MVFSRQFAAWLIVVVLCGLTAASVACGADSIGEKPSPGGEQGVSQGKPLPVLTGAQPNSEADLTYGKLLVRKPVSKFHVRQTAVITNNGFSPNTLIVLMPVARTNVYQDVSNVKAVGGTISPIPGSEDSYVRFTPTGDELHFTRKELICEYDVALYATQADLRRISRIRPYNEKSPIWIMYTGKSGDYVDPENSTIKTEGDRLWSESDNVVEYARRCYEYVAANYRYLNPGTGVHPLSKLIEQGGGDCGNLNSIFISLLRHKGIPARHLVSYRTGGGGHVWADFFLEDYGWIPVDVTSKNGNRSGDYFGKVECDSDCVILNRKLDLRLQVKDGELGTFGLLQGFFWWYWGSGAGDMSADYTVSAVRIAPQESHSP